LKLTLTEIGNRLGVSKMAVSKWAAAGHLKRNSKKLVDLTKHSNYDYLANKWGLDIMMKAFPELKRHKITEKPAPKQQNKKSKSKQITKNIIEAAVEKVVSTGATTGKNGFELDNQLKEERIINIQKQNELKELQLQEEKGRLINKSLVQNIIFDTLGIIGREIQAVPYSIVDEIISICATTQDTAREKIIKLLVKNYAVGMRNAVDESKKIFVKKEE